MTEREEPCQHEDFADNFNNSWPCRECGGLAESIIADLRAENARRECGICHQMTLIRNPHPDAGKPERLLEVGAEWVCYQCSLTANKRVRVQLADAEARAERLRKLAAEMRCCFTEVGHPGEPCHRTSWIRDSTLAKWDAALTEPGSEGSQ